MVLEHFLISMNNIGYMHAKRNKTEKSFYAFMKIFECVRHLEFASFFLKYHISTLALNLAFSIEMSHRNEASQMLMQSIMSLENLEIALDNHKNKDIIWSHISDKAFKFLLIME